MTTNQQLELGFNGTQSRIFGRRREERMARAKWWFAKMRAAVEQAWEEQVPARPEQILFVGVNREIKV
jgi:hypothetical protein